MRFDLQIFGLDGGREGKIAWLTQSGQKTGETRKYWPGSVNEKIHFVGINILNVNDFHSNRSNSDSEDDIEPDTVDQEYPSLDSVPSDNSLPGPTTFSPRNSEPPSLTESMQLMDEILSDKTMDRIERIDKLEAILSAATLLPSDPVSFLTNKLMVFENSTFYWPKIQLLQVITTLNTTSDTQSNSSSSYDSFQFIKTEPKR